MKGMSFHAYHGVFGAEKELGQKFSVDCELSANLRDAGKTDDLRLTLNYAKVYEDIRAIVQGERHNLVETVAERIAQTLIAKYPRIDGLTVRVKKPHVAIAGSVEYLGVEITRKREDFPEQSS